ncbi:MAG: TULIP family P47-like protein [Planctomycetota bacterium]
METPTAGCVLDQAPDHIEVRFPHLLQLPEALPALPGAASDVKASTYGWDTAFAIRMPDVNSAIVKAKCSPAGFSQVAPDGSCSASGTFGPWQLCRGGDGVLVHFMIPITSGRMTFQGKDTSLSGAVASIEVQLRHIPPQPKGVQASPSDHQLVIRVDGGSQTDPVVSVVDLKMPSDPGLLPKALISGLLSAWLNQNLDTFTHVFNTVTLNRIVDKKQFAWLAPTHTGYAFSSGPTDDSSILGVLCMTQGRTDDNIAAQLSPNAIPAGARAGFLISPQRFLEEMVLPALPKAFPGSSAADFGMTAKKDAVVNLAKVSMKPVEHMGITYRPVIQSLRISVEGEEIVVSSVTRTDIALGTYSEVTVTSFQRLKVADKPDGTQTLIYEETRPAIKDHVTKTTASGEAAKILLEIAAAIIAIVLTIVTDGGFLIIALIIVSLLVGLLEALPTVIANAVGNQVSNDSPSIALLVLNSTDPIRWPGGSDFRLTWAGLNESLQLGGDPGFS